MKNYLRKRTLNFYVTHIVYFLIFYIKKNKQHNAQIKIQ